MFDPTEDRGGDKLIQARKASADALRDAVAFTPALGSWPDLRRAFDEGIKAALLDGRDVRATLADIEHDWNRILRADIPATLDAIPRPGPVVSPAVSPGGAS